MDGCEWGEMEEREMRDDTASLESVRCGSSTFLDARKFTKKKGCDMI